MAVQNLSQLPDLGTDGAWFDGDLDARLGLVDGLTLLGQDLAARLQTPREGLWYDPDYGYDLRQWVNADYEPSDVFVIQSEVERECLKDERVEGCRATIEADDIKHTLSVTLNVTVADGPTYDLVLAVSDVTVDVLGIAETEVS